MTRRAALVLRACVLWTVWVWVVLIRNMVTDHHDSWSFRLVHIALALVSLAFAVAIWQITGRARRFTREVDRNFHFRPAIPEKKAKGRTGSKAPSGPDEPVVVAAKPAE